MAQLISPHVRVYDIGGHKYYDEDDLTNMRFDVSNFTPYPIDIQRTS